MKQIPNHLFFRWVEDEIANGHPVQFRLKGNSMYPFLRSDKDEVVLHPCSSDELNKMDVVLFRYKGNYLLHRIIRRHGNKLLIQGDGSYVAREECITEDVVGKVHTVIRPSGRILHVTDWKWRLTSFIWQNIGILRIWLLKIL